MNRRPRPLRAVPRPAQTFHYPQPTLFILIPLLALMLLLSGCNLPQVRAEDRLFLDISLDYLGSYNLPKLMVESTPVGGLSGITYDRQRDRFYAISDDRSDRAPARFYTLKSEQTSGQTSDSAKPFTITVEKVTTLLDQTGQPFAKGTLDPEGIALSPRRSLYISSEGVSRDGVAPFINEFDLETGQLTAKLPMPERFLPKVADGLPAGIVDNRGFESLTVIGNNTGTNPSGIEPFRVFAATESSLHQDLAVSRDAPPTANNPPLPQQPVPIRMLHYLVGEDLPTLLAEHVYMLEKPPEGALEHGLSEMLVLDQGGHFLTLERSYSLAGLSAQIYQMTPASATDTSDIVRLRGDMSGITPVYKQLVLDLDTLDLTLDNLEGMTLGPQLPDGSQTLFLVSDDNFRDLQTTQFLMFRIKTS
jgi:hypothetical protein